MSSFAQRLSLIVLVALLAATLPAARLAHAQTFTVTSTDDTDDNGATCPSTSCTLRKAIRLANASSGSDTITISTTGTINLLSALPALADTTGGTTINATTPHKVVINGGGIGTSAFGLRITSANNVVRGLVIIGFEGTNPAFGGAGILISGTAATNNVIANNWIGLNDDGTTVFGNDFAGILIDDGASTNLIGGTASGEGNVIAGNLRTNINVTDSDGSFSDYQSNNQIIGNYIGTNAAGTAVPSNVDQTNLSAGIQIGDYTRDTLVKGNLIGGHIGNTSLTYGAAGILLLSSAASVTSTKHPEDNQIVGNSIGLNAAGTSLANRIGIRITRGALNTRIGDPDDPITGRNVIGNSTENGIQINDTAYNVTGTQIVGNYIGVAHDGTTLATIGGTSGSSAGIYLGIATAGAPTPATIIGPANVISSVRRVGIRVRSSGNVIKGNFIGTNASGTTTSATSSSTAATKGYSFGDSAILVENGSANQIGGTTGGDRNVIAAGSGSITSAAAVVLLPAIGCSPACSVSATTIKGNYLGVSSSGIAALASSTSLSSVGVRITSSSDGTIVASSNTVQNNVIAGLGYGVWISNTSSGNTIDSNRIGTRASGSLAASQGIGNNKHGIYLNNSASNTITNNIIGFNGTSSSSSDTYYGIYATGSSGSNTIGSNQLGRNGSSSASNSSGIAVDGPSAIKITESTTTSHLGDGIRLIATGSNGNIVAPTLNGASGSVTAAILAGTTGCGAGCTVEVFTSSVNETKEGPVYLTSGTTTAGGAFSINVTGCLRYLTATVRDTSNNTSPFSASLDSGAAGPCTESTFSLSAASPNAQSVTLGSSYSYSHSITNNAAIARTFTVVITSTMGWASAPTQVDVAAKSTASFSVLVSVPYTAKVTPADKDITSVQVFVGTSGSNVVADTTTAKLNTPTPATPAISPGQTKTRTGTTLTFTHSVTNTGEVDGIFSVTGPSGSGLPTFVGTAPTGWSIDSATLAPSTVAAGASTTLTIVVNTPAGAAAGSVQFSFIVKASTGATTSPATVDTITVPVVRSFGFSAVAPTTKSSPPGISVSFTYAITNTGNASDTFLITPPTSTTPAGITSFTANPSTSFSLAAGASRTVTVSGTIPSSTSVGSYSFTVSAQGVGGTSPPAAKTASGTITVTGGGAPLFVGSASVTPNPVTAGNQVTIVHTVRNNGNQSSDFSFGKTLPSGWTFVSQTNTCATPVPADSSTCTVTTIVTVPASANGGSYPLTVSATATNSSGTSDDVTVSNVATVNVAIIRAVSLSVASPAAIQSGIPGTVLTYTHTLVNTGNATDSFTISVTPTAPATAAMAVVSPTSLDNVARNGSKTITLVVTIPNGVSTGDLTFTVTATSKNDASATASQVDTATVAEYDSASISAGTSKNGLPGTTLTFTHTLTNTGSTTIAYDITAANSDTNFAAPVITSGSTTAVLSPGTTATVVIQITLPSTLLGGTANTTTIEVTKAGTSAPILASATNQSRVGNAYDVQITPDRSGTGYPNSSLVFTHTVTNIGITSDTYTITGTNSLSWVMSVSPRSFTLAPGSSQEVSVLIDVPNDDRTLVGADNFGRVRVVSDTNPDDAYDEAVENIEIGQSASLIFTASQARAVTPSSGTIRMHDLVLNNTGNGSDTFDFTVLGADDGWEVNITSFDILGPRDTDYNIGVTVTVPEDVEPGPTKLITIRAKSRHDPTVYADVYLRFVYISSAVEATYGVYLPVIAR